VERAPIHLKNDNGRRPPHIQRAARGPTGSTGKIDETPRDDEPSTTSCRSLNQDRSARAALTASGDPRLRVGLPQCFYPDCTVTRAIATELRSKVMNLWNSLQKVQPGNSKAYCTRWRRPVAWSYWRIKNGTGQGGSEGRLPGRVGRGINDGQGVGRRSSGTCCPRRVAKHRKDFDRL